MRKTLSLIFALIFSVLWAESAFTRNSDTAEITNAVEKSLPLLQRIGPPFIENTGCVSCHNNALPAMAVALAREHGFKVDDLLSKQNTAAIMQKVESNREKLLFGIGIPGDATTVGYILLGLAAEKQPPDKNTEAMAHYLLGRQLKDGHWSPVSYRPPLEFSDFTTTAVTVRAIKAYAPKGRAEEVARRTGAARAWLLRATTKMNEDRVYQLLGLRWSGASKAEIDKAAKMLLSEQRSDGGWSQLPTLESDAYATGQALVALHEGSGLATHDPAYRRGVQFLLKTQQKDGSWLVETRSIPIQKYFESGFPHGKSQFISAAGTSWATMALVHSI